MLPRVLQVNDFSSVRSTLLIFTAVLAGTAVTNINLRQIRKILAPMPNDLTTLEAEIADLKKAVSDTATRVSNKLATLNPASPDYTADIQSLKDDVDALKAIAPDAAPPSNPDPVAGASNGLGAATPVPSPASDPVSPASTVSDS